MIDLRSFLFNTVGVCSYQFPSKHCFCLTPWCWSVFVFIWFLVSRVCRVHVCVSFLLASRAPSWAVRHRSKPGFLWLLGVPLAELHVAVAMRMTGPSSPAPCGIWPSPWVHTFQRRTPRHVLPCTPAAGDSAQAGQCAHTRVLLVVACGLRECVETEPCCGERRGRRGWRPASGRCHVSTERSRPPGWRPLGLGGGEGPRRTGRRCHPAAPHAASSGVVLAEGSACTVAQFVRRQRAPG